MRTVLRTRSVVSFPLARSLRRDSASSVKPERAGTPRGGRSHVAAGLGALLAASSFAPSVLAQCCPSACSLSVAGDLFLRLPYRSGESYRVTGGYCSGHHTGFEVDFCMPTGTPILAVTNGIVDRVEHHDIECDDIETCCDDPDDDTGTYVRLKHTDGSQVWYSYYGHLSATLVVEGDVVELGHMIGLSGNTGCSSAPHLHFQIRRDSPSGPGARPVPMATAGINDFVEGVSYLAPGFDLLPHGSHAVAAGLSGGGELAIYDDACSLTPWHAAGGAIGVVLDGPQSCSLLSSCSQPINFAMWKIDWGNGVVGWSAQNWLRPSSLPGTFILQPGPEGIDSCFGTSLYQNGVPNGQKLYFGGWGDSYFDFLQLDLSSAPAAEDTISAHLCLFAVTTPNDPMLEVRRIIEPWSEASVSLGNAPESAAYAEFGSLAHPTGWRALDITDLYKQWKDGSVPNHGLAFVPHATNQTNGWFWSSDHADPTLRPKLVITAIETTGADITGDGVVNGADLGILLAVWGCPPPPSLPMSDLNGDGCVDGADLGILLSDWD